MTQVNLLPTEVREGQRSRRALAAVILGVGAVVFLLLFIYTLQAARLANANHKLAAQQAFNQGLQTQINSLQQFAQLKAEVALRQTLTQQALQNEVRWSGVLRDVSMVIPNQMWLTGLSGTITEVSPSSGGAAPATGTAPAVAGPQTQVGTIQFSGMASDNPTLALWLSRLVRVRGWENSWLSTAQKTTDPNNGASSKMQFATSVDLFYPATVQGSKK